MAADLRTGLRAPAFYEATRYPQGIKSLAGRSRVRGALIQVRKAEH